MIGATRTSIDRVKFYLQLASTFTSRYRHLPEITAGLDAQELAVCKRDSTRASCQTSFIM